MGAIFEKAKKDWQVMHGAWEGHIEWQYERALQECNGVLVNHLGRSKGIDGYTLFSGQLSRALKYASEELIAYWAHNRRLTLAQFEEQWVSGIEEYYGI